MLETDFARCPHSLQHLVSMTMDPITNRPVCERLVLAFKDDDKSQDALVEVDKSLVKQLKPHQVEGEKLCH